MVSVKKRLVQCCISISLLMLIPGAASAERFADLFVGLSYTQDEDLKFSSANQNEEVSMSFRASFTIGYRMGYWFDRLPNLGLALDATYTNIESDELDDYIDVVSITPLLMARLPLMRSQKYPMGEWAPFFAVGPGLFISKISAVDGAYADRHEDLGIDLRTGVKKMMAINWALNLEYRFFYVAPEYEDYDVDAEIDLYTHSLMVGMTYNF